MTVSTHEGIGSAATWRLLSLGFMPPSRELVDELQALAGALYDVGPTPELEDLLDALRDADVHDLAPQHAALFRGKVLVAPYEGSYELDPIRRGRQMADVAAFYRAFGAEAHGPAAERPDFVGCELEFLSFLELRRLTAHEAAEDGVEIVDEIRDAFLADHAGRWLPTFFADVILAAGQAGFYGRVASFGASVLAAELSRLGIAQAPLSRPAGGSPLDADTLECGTSGALARDHARTSW